MSVQTVEANEDFCRRFTPEGSAKAYNVKIAKGAKGVVEDGRVTFDLGNGELGSAPLAGESNIFSSDHIPRRFLKYL